ncbi:MAG: hypothetical protein K0S44_1096 [Bacteroidetes bacterium]|jgi:hypothetical protein|nr:hypothetical protein [Bacteroidota bacterium]
MKLNYTFTIILFAFSFLLFSFADNNSNEKIDRILNADTIAFDIYSGGCFSSSDNFIVILKKDQENYLLSLTNNKKKVTQKHIKGYTLRKFGESFKKEMAKEYTSGCTTSTTFVLSSKGDTVSFNYHVCNSTHTPAKEFSKTLGIKLETEN